MSKKWILTVCRVMICDSVRFLANYFKHGFKVME